MPIDQILRITREDGTRLEGAQYPLARVLRDGKRLRDDATCFAPPGGSPIPVSFTAAPLRKGGEVSGVVLVFRDLLDVRRAEREQRFLAQMGELLGSSLEVRTTLSQIAHAAVPLLADVCVVDELDENRRVHRIDVVFATGEHDELAESVRRFTPSAEGTSPLARALREGEATLMTEVSTADVAQDDEHARMIDESGLSSMMVVPLIARERTIGALTFGALRSSRRFGPREFAFAEDLARRAALAADNARLFEQAQHATRARQELLSLVSHDLRNPLSSVMMATQVLLETPLPPAQVQLALERIQRASARANRLVEDLLDISNIESGQFGLQLSTHALAQLLEECIENNGPQATAAGLRLVLEPPPALDLRCDRERVLQVLGNLVGNAIKFTPAGGSITVKAEQRDDTAQICVTDTGIGIPPAAIAHVFDRYWQMEHAGRAGAGLGLSIAQGLATAHGGRIWAESEEDAGSTFCFTLPLAK